MLVSIATEAKHHELAVSATFKRKSDKQESAETPGSEARLNRLGERHFAIPSFTSEPIQFSFKKALFGTFDIQQLISREIPLELPEPYNHFQCFICKTAVLESLVCSTTTT